MLRANNSCTALLAAAGDRARTRLAACWAGAKSGRGGFQAGSAGGAITSREGAAVYRIACPIAASRQCCNRLELYGKEDSRSLLGGNVRRIRLEADGGRGWVGSLPLSADQWLQFRHVECMWKSDNFHCKLADRS